MRSLGIGLAWNKLGSFLAQVVAYFTEGRVLDYSTDVGPFTIVDQSDEGNTATLYSGRGATIGPAANTITYPTGYSSAERTATVWMRVDVLGARTLNGATGTFTFTPTATGIWEQLSSTATVSGNLSWTPGSDCDIGDLTCATEHWTHDDFSNPTGDTSNGKTIVDSGPNDAHGTCTGCAGFTGEGIDPAVAGIVGLDDARYFDGASNGTVALTSAVTMSGDFTVSGTLMYGQSTATTQVSLGNSVSGTNRFGITGANAVLLEIDNNVYVLSTVLSFGVCYDFSIVRVGTNTTVTFTGLTPEVVVTTAGDFVIDQIGLDGAANNDLDGIIYNLDFNSQAAYTGLGTSVTAWEDTIGSNDGTEVNGISVGQKRATIPQTADRNWNKYDYAFPAVYESDLSVEDGWTGSNGTYSFNESIGGQSPVGKFIVNTTTSVRRVQKTVLSSGSTNRITGEFYIPSSNDIVSTIQIRDNSGGILTVLPVPTEDTWTAFDVSGVAASEILQFRVQGGAADAGGDDYFAFRNVKVELLLDSPQLVSASDADDQVDAYGTAILEPRTNAQVINIFGDGELVKTPAAASLDTIKAVSGWIWHNGTARTVIDLGTPTVGTTATDLTSSGFTGVTYFVDGQSGTTLSDGWNHCVVASTAALATDDIDILAKSGSSIDYITTLTVAEALQNFNAQKALYNISNGAVLPATLPATL